MKVLQTIFAVLICAVIAQVIYYYPRIPNIVASHFDGLGAPNGWSSKAVFFGIYLAVILMTVLIFVVLPKFSITSRVKGLKIPNREYWLEPDRREATIQFYRKHFLAFGIVNTLFALVVIQLVIQANFKEEPRLDFLIVWVLGLFFVFVIFWLFRFFFRFKRT